MYSLFRSLLFKMDAEKAHKLALSALHYLPSFCFNKPSFNPITALGLHFNHPVGLAAGFDKNGEYLADLEKLGFSFIEVGTVTPKSQEGNPKPRLFRYPNQQAIVNRMGFNNKGVDVLVKNIKHSAYKGILGINIGKNKETDLNRAHEDYLYCLRQVYPYASYITINISSPNTPSLRQLQQEEYFSALLNELSQAQRHLEDIHQRKVPLLVKISPDEEADTLKKMVDLMLLHGIEGVIATNTTTQAHLLLASSSVPQGGLSGMPLQQLATMNLALIKGHAGNKLTLIGVGGIHDVASAQEKINAGASLVQLYTGLIYEGPQLIPELAKHLQNKVLTG
ncbi:MAG: dihydroorotate dehydrogenase (quinone) [Legionella sp.]|nr:MAG: dihydroorotate dehydrogenase (quinone) [Legionella sp.]PJD98657.1 MAG: dihydroorotate dehydrogenase (quinone) [Legionella sp.]